MQMDFGPNGVHASHMENRIAYAERIIAWLDENIAPFKAGNLAALNGPTWDRIATQAGEKTMPSKATVSCIIGMVHMRETIAAQTATVSVSGRRLLALNPGPVVQERV